MSSLRRHLASSWLRKLALLYLALLVWVAAFADLLASDAPLIAVHRERAPSVDVLPAVLRARALAPMSRHEITREFADAIGVWPPISHDPRRASPEGPGAGASLAHPAGTDAEGIDVLSRSVHGTRSVVILVAAVSLLAGPLGLFWGLLAGGGSRAVEFLLSRGVEVSGLWPSLVLLAILRTIEAAPAFATLALVLGAVQCLRVAQVVRAETLSVTQKPFVQAAVALGASRSSVLLRHVLPHVTPALWASLVAGAAQVVGLEAGLTVIGFGLPESIPTWGSQLGEAGTVGMTALALPALGVCLTTAALQVLADALDDAVAPKSNARPLPAGG